MYGFIFGFHRLARCPKWTPASIRSLTASATKFYLFPRENSGPRSRDGKPRATVLREIRIGQKRNPILSTGPHSVKPHHDHSAVPIPPSRPVGRTTRRG